MRKFVALEPPKDFDPRLYHILKNIQAALGQSQAGFSRISRGEQPDGGGAPIIDESRFVLLAGRDSGQQVKGSNRTIGTTGITRLGLYAYNSTSASSLLLNNATAILEATQVTMRAPTQTDQPLLIAFGTTSFPVVNYAGVVLTGVLNVQGVPSSDNYAFGVQHSNLPTTSVTAWVQKRAAQTGNLFEWRTGVSPMSYIRASDGGFVGPITASGSDVHPDDIFQVTDNVDPSKILMLQLSGITTASTRVWTVPDFDGTPALFRTGMLRIGDSTAPTNWLEIAAGTATVAPMLFASGTLLTTPVTGALEFFGNRLYSTSSVGPTRRIILMVAGSTALTSTRVPFVTTAGEITSDARMVFQTSSNPFTLAVGGTIQAITGFTGGALLASQGGLNVTAKANFGFGVGGYIDDATIKVQSDYIDTTTAVSNIRGLSSYLRVQNSGSSAANFIGMDGLVYATGSGVTPSGPGVGLVGLRGTVQINSASTFDSVTGLNGLIYTENNNPTITNAYAIAARWSHNSGTIVNAFGIYADNPSGGAGVTNNYLLYLTNPTTGSTSNFAIYSVGGKSIHVGELRLGDTTTPSHRLEIAAGTTAIAPIRLFYGGNLLTTPLAGAIEYDTQFFYLTHTDAIRTKIVTERAPLNLTAQGAAIGSTTLYATDGYFVVNYTLEVTTLDITAGTIQFQVGYSDDVGATTQVSAALALTTTGRTTGSFQVWKVGGNITYQTNLTGIIGAAKYALRVRLAAL